MIKPVLSISGFKDLDADFKLLSDVEQRQVSKKAVKAGAIVFRDAIKANAAVDSGTLKRSISVDMAKGPIISAGVKFKQVRVRKKLKGEGVVSKKILPFYWWMLENGTSKMPAKPFVRPGFDENIKKAEDAAFSQFLADIDRIFLK